MRGFFATLKNAVFGKDDGDSVESVNVSLEVSGKNADSGRMVFPAGFYGIPQDAIQGVVVNINGQNVVVSCENFGFDKKDVLDKGSSMLYGYDDSGSVKGFVLVDSEGLMSMKNDITSLKTILDNFIVQGGPAQQTTSEITKLEIAKLFKE